MPPTPTSSADRAGGSGKPRPARPGRVRLDQLLVERGLAATRAEALRLVLAGRVRVDGAAADKPGRLCRADVQVTVTAVSPFVGRGGEKLTAALERFGVNPAGRVCLDVGASTGGFTDCLLQRGARRVYAVDVGHGQLHPRIAGDARVTALEGVNARNLTPARLDEPPTLATVDVSFISLEKVIPAVAACLSGGAEIVALAKPQFEVGRGRVGKGGVVRDAAGHREVLRRLAAFATPHGLGVHGIVASPLRGARGNREFFLLLAEGPDALPPAAITAAIDAAVDEAEDAAPTPTGSPSTPGGPKNQSGRLPKNTPGGAT
jgi:23S rRNA (cytidine1920-2'-O)/16S rRNA (cytidine1409-2'-O)-methyltransferase